MDGEKYVKIQKMYGYNFFFNKSFSWLTVKLTVKFICYYCVILEIFYQNVKYFNKASNLRQHIYENNLKFRIESYVYLEHCCATCKFVSTYTSWWRTKVREKSHAFFLHVPRLSAIRERNNAYPARSRGTGEVLRTGHKYRPTVIKLTLFA